MVFIAIYLIYLTHYLKINNDVVRALLQPAWLPRCCSCPSKRLYCMHAACTPPSKILPTYLYHLPTYIQNTGTYLYLPRYLPRDSYLDLEVGTRGRYGIIDHGQATSTIVHMQISYRLINIGIRRRFLASKNRTCCRLPTDCAANLCLQRPKNQQFKQHKNNQQSPQIYIRCATISSELIGDEVSFYRQQMLSISQTKPRR